jgi:hypothetical protein
MTRRRQQTWHGMRVTVIPIDMSTWQMTHSRASLRTTMSATVSAAFFSRRNVTNLEIHAHTGW